VTSPDRDRWCPWCRLGKPEKCCEPEPCLGVRATPHEPAPLSDPDIDQVVNACKAAGHPLRWARGRTMPCVACTAEHRAYLAPPGPVPRYRMRWTQLDLGEGEGPPVDPDDQPVRNSRGGHQATTRQRRAWREALGLNPEQEP
jgi:hypothetical protein